MNSNKLTEDQLALDNIKRFIQNSENIKLLNSCYNAVRDEDNNRRFDSSIPEMTNGEFDTYYPLISAVILTANKFECDTLNFIAYSKVEMDVKKRKDNIAIFEGVDFCSPTAYLIKLKSTYILHLCAYETGSNTPGGSSDLVRYVTKNPQLQPTCIISFGICYGRNPAKQTIGDVIIPAKLYPWSIGQKIVDKEFKLKHDNFQLFLEDKFSAYSLYSSLRNYCNGDEGKTVHQELDIDKCKSSFSIKVTYGNMSTGEGVISSGDLKKVLEKATHIEKEMGGEMEGYGVAKECIYYSKIPCIILKSICDWGACKDIEEKLKKDGVEHPYNLKDKLQAYASFCAGIVLVDLLNKHTSKILKLAIIRYLEENNICGPVSYTEKKKIIEAIKLLFGDMSENEYLLKKLIEMKKLITVKKGYNEIVYRIGEE